MTEIKDMSMTMKALEEHAEFCLENDIALTVLIDMPGFVAPEMITNEPVNIKKKIEYYKVTYDENCNHRHASGIRIIGVAL